MMAHLFPHPRRPAELILAQKWNNVRNALADYRAASTPLERAYHRGYALYYIRAFKLADAGR